MLRKSVFKKKSSSEIIKAIIIRLFHIYPILFFSPLFNSCLLLLLVVISPWRKIKIGGLVTERIGHLAVNTDLFLRRRQLGRIPGNIEYVFLAGKPCNRQLLNMWKRYLHVIEDDTLHKLFNKARWLWKRTSFYEPLQAIFNEYPEYQKTEPTLEFTPQEQKHGCKQLQTMGINPDKDWFVCIFARDPAYLNTVYPKGNWEYHDYRNADINNFMLASKYITSLGGYVIRIGSHVNKAIEIRNTKIIDYAKEYRTDFMDIYLISKCRFVMGNTSGICDVAMLFEVPYLGINCIPIGNVPHGKNSLFIPKKIKDRGKGSLVTFSRIIEETKDGAHEIWTSNWWCERGYELVENTEDEILRVTEEMVQRLESDFFFSEDDSNLLDKYFQLYSEDHWAKEIKTPIGIDFLKRNIHLFFTS